MSQKKTATSSTDLVMNDADFKKYAKVGVTGFEPSRLKEFLTLSTLIRRAEVTLNSSSFLVSKDPEFLALRSNALNDLRNVLIILQPLYRLSSNKPGNPSRSFT